MKDKFNNKNADLKIKKLNLGLQVVKKKFLAQIKLLEYSPKEKISHVLLRNILVFHNVMYRLNINTKYMNDSVKKMKSKNMKDEEKTELKKNINERQIITYALMKNLMNMFDSYSIFDHDYEIESLTGKNKSNVYDNIPTKYHPLVKQELDEIKPLMPDQLPNEDKIVEGFGNPFTKAIDVIVGGIKKVIGLIGKGIGKVKDFIMDIIKKIGDVFMKIFGFMEDIFKNLKMIVEFIGGFLFQVIDIFFKLLKFVWLLITKWIPWLVMESWKYLMVWFKNWDIIILTFVLQFPLNDFINQVAGYAIPYSDEVVGYMQLGQLLSFYCFWIYPKSLRWAQMFVFNKIKDFIISMANFGKEPFGKSSKAVQNALKSLPLPYWFIDWFRSSGPKMNMDTSSFTSDKVSVLQKILNFNKFLFENIGVIPLKLLIMGGTAMIFYKTVWPIMKPVIPTIKELTQTPVVLVADLKRFIFWLYTLLSTPAVPAE